MNIQKIIKRIKQSKDGKVLISNFAYLSLLQVAGYVFPLITMPYLAKVIGVEGFGKIAFASAIIVWIQTIADWGFNYTATRDVAKNKEDKNKVSDIFSNVFWARCLLMLISFVFLSILVISISIFRENATVIFVTFLMIPGHIMFPDWFFQAIEKMKYITLLNLCSKLLFTILVFVFIKEKNDYILQPLFISLGFVLAGLIAMYYILIKWKIRLKFVSFSSILNTIKASSDIFLNNLMPNLYASLATVLLGIFHGNKANGIYEAGVKFVNIFDQIAMIVSRVFFPYLSRNISKHSLYAKLSIMLSLLLSCLLFLGAPFMIKLFFTPEFSDAIVILRLLSFLIVLLTIDRVYGINYLIVQGYDKQRRKICLISSLIGSVVAILLVYYFSCFGKAISLLFANGLMALLSLCYVKKITKHNKVLDL